MRIGRGDEERWARALGGDAGAFRALFAEHRDRVFRYAIRLTEQLADAEDVAAAAFLELWRLRERVRLVDGSVLPWLLVTTGNLARNHRRGLSRHRAALERLPHRGGSTASALPADQLLLDLEVRGALKRLSAADAALLLLTAVEGFTSGEAAAALGISAGTARNRLVRIRRGLRSDLAHLRQPETNSEATR